jgi:hypothetical protein
VFDVVLFGQISLVFVRARSAVASESSCDVWINSSTLIAHDELCPTLVLLFLRIRIV